jgi:hypothetical protein
LHASVPSTDASNERGGGRRGGKRRRCAAAATGWAAVLEREQRRRAAGIGTGAASSGLSVNPTTFTDVPGGSVGWTFSNIDYLPQSGSALVTINPVAATISVTGYSGNYTASPPRRRQQFGDGVSAARPSAACRSIRWRLAGPLGRAPGLSAMLPREPVFIGRIPSFIEWPISVNIVVRLNFSKFAQRFQRADNHAPPGERE